MEDLHGERSTVTAETTIHSNSAEAFRLKLAPVRESWGCRKQGRGLHALQSRGLFACWANLFIPCDSTSRCSCKLTSQLPACLLGRALVSRHLLLSVMKPHLNTWSPDHHSLKSLPNLHGLLHLKCPHSFDFHSFLHFLNFPAEVSPHFPSWTGACPDLSVQTQHKAGNFPPLLSTVTQISSLIHCSTGAAWCAGYWIACLAPTQGCTTAKTI